MPRTDLYLIPGSAFSDVCEFCIRLCEKAYRAGHRVHIIGRAEHETETIDRMLWEADKTSFLPHCTLDPENRPDPPPITISNQTAAYPDPEQRDLLIHYDDQLPEYMDTFKRVALIIPNLETSLTSARSNYKALAARKLTVHSHDLRK